MPDYSTGKIYKIINSQNKIVYIGSTVQKLSSRFCNHKYNGNGHKIILLENCPCNSREELVKKEQDYIDSQEDLLNQMRAYRTEEYKTQYRKEYKKEYSKTNKDKISESSKLYYINNKDKIKVYRETNKNKISEQKKVRVICECGYEVGKYDIEKHRKTQRHINLLKDL
tara:strand:- start:27 stop:533 length:507 start_codon:yes stop_codon:yes gene_type:complete